MNKKLLNLFGYILTIGLFSWILYHFHDQTDWSLLFKLFRHPFLATAHLILLFATSASFIIAWYLLLTSRAVHCPFWKAAGIWLIPNLGKYIPGRVLLPMARTELLHRNGFSRGHAFTYFVLEQCIMVLGALPFALIPAILLLRQEGPIVLGLISAAILIFLVLAARPNLIVHGLNLLLRILKQPRLDPDFAQIPSFRLALLYSLGWLTYGLSGLVLATGLELPFSTLGAPIACALIAAWLIGFLSIFTPGGLGVREAVSVALLAPYMAAPDALILAVLLRFSWTLTEILGVAFGFTIYRHVSPHTHFNLT